MIAHLSLPEIIAASGLNFEADYPTAKDFVRFNIVGEWWGLVTTQDSCIRFGALLEILEKHIIPQNKSGNLSNPSLNIDYDPSTSFCITNPYQISSDPRICLIDPGTLTVNGVNYDLFELGKNGKWLNPYKVRHNGKEYGQIMNIYLNSGYISNLLTTLQDGESGRTSLYDFLKQICDDVNIALGSINQLEPIIDEDTNSIKILEQANMAGRDELIRTIKPEAELETTEFLIYGFNNDRGGFVKSYGLKTEITNKLATEISIGAQASYGTVNGIDTSAWAFWNKGITDRIIPKKVDSTIKGSSNDEEENYKNEIEKEQNKFNNAKELYIKLITDYNDEEKEGLKYNILDEASYKTSVKNMIESSNALQSIRSVREKSIKVINPSIGFIPINLNISMEGMSGVKIYQKYSVNQQFLPSSVPEALDFLIIGVTHKIAGNVWTTDLDGLSMPKNSKIIEEKLVPITDEDTQETSEWMEYDKAKKYTYRQSTLSFGTNISGIPVTLWNQPTIPSQVASYLNPAVRDVMEAFLEQALTDTNGVEMIITSGFRNLGAQSSANSELAASAGKSAHQYGLGIDMVAYDMLTGKRHKLIGVKPTKTLDSAGYATDLPDIANQHGLRWGGLWRGNGYDPVHFDAANGWVNASGRCKQRMLDEYDATQIGDVADKWTPENIYNIFTKDELNSLGAKISEGPPNNYLNPQFEVTR